MSRKQIGIILEGQTFNSIKEAADYIKTDSGCILWALKYNADRKYKGLSIAYADADMEKNAVANIASIKASRNAKIKAKKSKKIDKRACPVICETNNKRFKTITAAAKYAKANSWTMGMKMDVHGRFVDKEGNVYKRLKPMVTKNKYMSKFDTITKEVHRGYNKAEPVADVKIQTDETTPVIVLRNQAIDHIRNGNYNRAQQFIAALDIITSKKQ